MSTSDRHEIPRGSHESAREALAAFSQHCAGCRTCMQVDDAGRNLNLPCREATARYQHWRDARRAPSGGTR